MPTLPIKKKWFEMIRGGEKKGELLNEDSTRNSRQGI